MGYAEVNFITANGRKYKIGGEIEILPCQIEIMFNRSRWANNCTVTPLFYICCYGAFLVMKCVKFSKDYIKREFYGVPNANKIHGMAGNTPYTFCGMANETDNEFKGKITCPDCIDFIKSVQKLKRGVDF